MGKLLSLKELLQDMITMNSGRISSKIVIGAVTYLLLTISIIVVMFVNPSFPGLSELISILMITSASLLGLTTVENIKQVRHETKN